MSSFKRFTEALAKLPKEETTKNKKSEKSKGLIILSVTAEILEKVNENTTVFALQRQIEQLQKENKVLESKAEQYFNEKEIALKRLYEIEDLQESTQSNSKVIYVCDERACKHCSKCGFISDIRHAKNFSLSGNIFKEKNTAFYRGDKK